MPKNKRHTRVFILLFFFILSAVIFLDKRSLLDKPKNIIYSLITPVQRVAYQFSIKIGDSMSGFFSWSEIKKENDELKLVNENLKSETVKLKEVELENQFLRKQLGLALEKQSSLKLGYVVGAGIGNVQKIIIDKGFEHNIQAGDAVISAGNIFLGKVEKVYQNRSEVILINDPESKIPVLIQESRAQGIVKGEHGTEVLLDFVPLENETKVGDKVITAAIDNIPAGLLVGEIEQVDNQTGSLFKKAVIKPSFLLNNIEKVFVITK